MAALKSTLQYIESADCVLSGLYIIIENFKDGVSVYPLIYLGKQFTTIENNSRHIKVVFNEQ